MCDGFPRKEALWQVCSTTIEFRVARTYAVSTALSLAAWHVTVRNGSSKWGRAIANDDRHPGGKYNVVQSITGIKKCPLFEPADPDVVRKLESRLAELRLAGVSNPAVPVK